MEKMRKVSEEENKCQFQDTGKCVYEEPEGLDCLLCLVNILNMNFTKLYNIARKTHIPYVDSGKVVSVTKSHLRAHKIYIGWLEKYSPERYEAVMEERDKIIKKQNVPREEESEQLETEIPESLIA
jgi:hypothetical protein